MRGVLFIGVLLRGNGLAWAPVIFIAGIVFIAGYIALAALSESKKR
jgi:hypothetical protein